MRFGFRVPSLSKRLAALVVAAVAIVVAAGAWLAQRFVS